MWAERLNDTGIHRLSGWVPTLVIGGLTTVSFLILSIETIPLGVSGEWTWPRRDWLAIDPTSVVLCLLLSVGYCLGVVLGEQRWGRSRWAPLWISLLAFSWLGGVLCALPGFQGIGRAPTVLYYKRTEGYFWQAAFDVQDSRQFLKAYQESISTGDDPDRYLHLGTHPPGLTLLYRGLLGLNSRLPGLAQSFIASEPRLIREAFDTLKHYPTPNDQPLTEVDEATLWAASCLTLLMTAFTCWPIYLLIHRQLGSIAAWRGAALWPLVPSLLVFYPKSDLLCPLIATTSCWLWMEGWSSFRRGLCLLAGFGFFVGCMLTLALAPVALLLVLQTVFERWLRREEFRNRSTITEMVSVSTAVIGFAGPAIALSIWGNCNLPGIWFENLKNHAMFYEHHTRTYLSWLWVNPIEGALALGTPLTGLMLWSLVLLVCKTGNTIHRSAWAQTSAWMIVWGILWLSGKNMGEAARLWIFLAPWPVMSAAVLLSPNGNIAEVSVRPAHVFSISPEERHWVLFLILQIVVTLWTVFRVDGFHFDELMSP